MNECAGREFNSQDSQLNSTYQALLQKYSKNPKALEKLRAAQRAWVSYRDAHVASLYEWSDAQGSVTPMCISMALSSLTHERLKLLKDMLNPEDGDVCGMNPPRLE